MNVLKQKKLKLKKSLYQVIKHVFLLDNQGFKINDFQSKTK